MSAVARVLGSSIVLAVLAAATAVVAFAQDGTPTQPNVQTPASTPTPPSAPVLVGLRLATPNSAHESSVEVIAEGVANLGAFQFTLQYDGDKVEFTDVTLGDFLGSSGREVYCLDPVAAPGSLQYQCVTLGAVPAQGAGGTGALASVQLSQTGAGQRKVELVGVKLTDPMGNQIPSMVSPGKVELFAGGGRGWMFVVLVVGGLAGVAAIVAGAGAALIVRRSRRQE